MCIKSSDRARAGVTSLLVNATVKSCIAGNQLHKYTSSKLNFIHTLLLRTKSCRLIRVVVFMQVSLQQQISICSKFKNGQCNTKNTQKRISKLLLYHSCYFRFVKTHCYGRPTFRRFGIIPKNNAYSVKYMDTLNKQFVVKQVKEFGHP